MTDYKSILFFIILIIGLYFLNMFADSLFGRKANTLMPYHTKHILTSSEYKFYNALKPVLDVHSYIICPKVGLKDLFEVNKGIKNRQKYFYKISQKHVDFLVCDVKLKPLFAIELDDKSHRRSDVKERDSFKNQLFEKCGLPLYRVPVNTAYSEEYLKKYIPTLGVNKDEKVTR